MVSPHGRVHWSSSLDAELHSEGTFDPLLDATHYIENTVKDKKKKKEILESLGGKELSSCTSRSGSRGVTLSSKTSTGKTSKTASRQKKDHPPSEERVLVC